MADTSPFPKPGASYDCTLAVDYTGKHWTLLTAPPEIANWVKEFCVYDASDVIDSCGFGLCAGQVYRVTVKYYNHVTDDPNNGRDVDDGFAITAVTNLFIVNAEMLMRGQ